MRHQVLLNDEQLSVLADKKQDLLPKFLYSQLKAHQTSLGDNPAFPPENGYSFDYTVIKKRYGEIVHKAVNIFGNDILKRENTTSVMSQLLAECKKIEKPLRAQLEKIVENAINRIFAIPEETVIFECHLVDKVVPSHMPTITPENNSENGHNFADIADYTQTSQSVQKRRLINSLMQGGAITLSRITKSYMDELEKISSTLPSLYKKILVLNDLLLFTKKEKINDFHTMEGAFVVTKLGTSDIKTTIEAQGVIFPLLLQESIKGFLELFASHGLPKDKEKAEYIIKHSDFLLAEPWDMRFGPELWHRMLPDNMDTNAIPYYFSYICKLPTDEFNEILQEVFFGSETGNNFKNWLLNKVAEDADYQRFENNLNAKKVDKSVIVDGYFAGADEDAYIVDGGVDGEDEDLITDEISLLSELES